MRIDSIYLKNFLSHTENSINFKGKVNVIIGHNGAGKSSIVDGIVFALYRESNRAKTNNLIKLGTKNSSISLLISDNENKIDIKRNLPTGATDLLIKNGAAIARGAEKVTEELEKIVNMDKNIMLSTIIVRQGEIEDIFKNLTDVLKNIMKVENLEKLTASNGPIYSVIKDINLKLELIQKTEKDYNDIKNSLMELAKTYESLSSKLQELNDRKKEIDNREEEIDEKYKELEKKRDIYLSLKNTLSDKQNELERLRNELAKIGDVEKQLQDIQEKINKLSDIEQAKNLSDELKRIKKDLDTYTKSKNDLIKEIDNIEKSLKRKEEISNEYLRYIEVEELLEELEKSENEYNKKLTEKETTEKRISELKNKINMLTIIDINEIQKKIDELEKKISDLSIQKGLFQSELTESENIINGLKNVKDNKCPLCKSPLDEEHKKQLINEAREKYNSRKQDIANLENEIRKTQTEKSKLYKDLDINRKKQATYAQLSEELNIEKEKLNELEKELKDLENKHNKYQKLKSEEKELKPIYEEYMRLSDVTEEYLNSKKQQLENIDKNIEEKTEREKDIKSRLGNLTDEEILEKIDELRRARAEQERINKLIGKKQTYRENMDILEKNINEIKNQLSSINFSEKDYEKIKQDKEDILKEQKDIIAKISEIKGNLDRISKDIEEKKKKLNEIESEIKNKEKLENAKKKLLKLREELGEKGLQSYIISAVKSKIENNLNEIASMFNLAFTRISLDFEPATRGQKLKADISAFDNYGREFSIDMMSGGEKISIALALRLAIAKSLMDTVGFMILDEPTIHLDEERRKELMNVIRNSLNMVPQIIIVTHDDEILEIGDYIIRLEKRGSESKVFEEVPGSD